MTRFGIYFDYKVANRHAWQYCAVVVLMGLFLWVGAFHTTLDYYMNGFSPFNLIKFVGSAVHQNQMLTAPLLAYIYLTRNLQKRYAVLNQLLEKRIFDRNKVHRSINDGKVYTIETIKFIGQYHGQLTKIMDLVNFCCSFQVCCGVFVLLSDSVNCFFALAPFHR